MSHPSKHHFSTQYISLNGSAVNEFYRTISMEVAGHVRGNRKETKLSPVTLAGIFKLYRKFLSMLQTRNHEINRQIFYSARFSLEWQKELCS